MNTLKFKTDIKCTGCLEKVTPHMEGSKGIKNWEVDLQNPDRVLTAQVEGLSQDDLISTIGKAGFKAEPVQ